MKWNILSFFSDNPQISVEIPVFLFEAGYRKKIGNEIFPDWLEYPSDTEGVISYFEKTNRYRFNGEKYFALFINEKQLLANLEAYDYKGWLIDEIFGIKFYKVMRTLSKILSTSPRRRVTRSVPFINQTPRSPRSPREYASEVREYPMVLHSIPISPIPLSPIPLSPIPLSLRRIQMTSLPSIPGLRMW